MPASTPGDCDWKSVMPDLTVPYGVPYICQFASPALVKAFIDGERALESDPNWAAYGAESPAEYAHWALRACGVVCVKMAVDGLTGVESGPVMDWVRAGLALDGYLAEQRADRRVEIGWKHAALAQLAADRGCEAALVQHLTLDDLAAHVEAGKIVIASVSSEIGEGLPITRRNGHLVVVYGIALDGEGEVEAVILHNPSGRTAALQAGARVPAGRFREAFSGRGIIVGAAQK
jgi:hypothetical protein